MNSMIKDTVKLLRNYKVNDFKPSIKLDANESPFNLGTELKAKIMNSIIQEDFNRYPDDNLTELKGALANYVGLKNENIICGNGSDQIIKNIIDAFIDKDDSIVTHSPTFSMYKIVGQIGNGKVIQVIDDENFNIQIDEIIAKANKEKAKLIFLCNPNNPTGQIISKKDILKVLNKTKSIVVVDEAYYEFYGETMALDIKENKRLIILRTLSKAFGIAALRVGYGIANEETIEILNRVKPPYNLNSISQIIACEVVKDRKTIKMNIEYLKNERNYLFNKLSEIKNINPIPSYGNFILVKIKNPNLPMIIKNFSIGIRDYPKDSTLKDCIRITIGTREENDRLLAILKEVS